MATQRVTPDVLITQTGLTGTVANIVDDPDSPDGNWLTTSNNTSTVCHVSFLTPSSSLNTGAGLQEFRCLVRKTNQSTNPTATVDLYENGTLITNLVSSTTISTTTGIVLSGTWNASLLGTSDGSLVECRITGTPGGGSPGNRASVEVGAIEWNANYTVPASGGPSTNFVRPASGQLYPRNAYSTGSLFSSRTGIIWPRGTGWDLG